MQQLRHQGELSKDAIPQAAFGNIQQMAAQIAHDPTGVALQLLQCLAHALELLGMGLAANLQRQSGREARVGLPQFHPGLLTQYLWVVHQRQQPPKGLLVTVCFY